MTITIKSNPDGVSGAIQVNGVDKVTIGASGITAGAFAPNSIDAAAVALAFSGANQSLGGVGYQKLPSGLIIQWGYATTSGGSASVTFPIAFPNAVFIVAASVNAANSNQLVSTGGITSSGFPAYVFQANTGVNSDATFTWVGFGY